MNFMLNLLFPSPTHVLSDGVLVYEVHISSAVSIAQIVVSPEDKPFGDGTPCHPFRDVVSLLLRHVRISRAFDEHCGQPFHADCISATVQPIHLYIYECSLNVT